MRIEIKHRFTGKVLFAHDADNNSVRKTAIEALRFGADLSWSDLSWSDLSGADLSGANLSGANLSRANLSRANLSRADLSWSDLSWSDLSRANLSGADLSRANLSGADLREAKLRRVKIGYEETLVGNRPLLQIGPIGSRGDNLTVFMTDCGLRIATGCFFGNEAQFISRVQARHGGSEHAVEYMAALHLIDKHVEVWGLKQ